MAVAKALPKEYRFELGSQLVRSSLSIVLNIAEGSWKKSDKELNRFLEISLGSAYETLACLDALKNTNLLSKSDFENFQGKISNICSQLGGLKKKLTA